jgi:hypothetical protein
MSIFNFNTKKYGSNQNQATNLDVDISLSKEEPPKFERIYKKKFDNGIRIEIKARRSRFSRSISYTGELTQPDRRWVFFDPERVADKIIDRDLVPVVQSFCFNILAMDKEWRASSFSNEFIDEDNVRWIRS